MKSLRLAAAAALLCFSTAEAEEAGALVIDVLGDVSPEVGPFEDVPVGTVLTLGDGTEMIISHYKACEEVTLVGGKVTIGADGLDIAGGTVSGREPVDCPEEVVLAAVDTASATVVVRDVIELAKVPISPRIVLVGDGADGYDTLTISRDGTHVRDLAIKDRQVLWPESGLYLSDRTQYELSLTGPAGKYTADVVADRRTKSRVVLRP